MLRELGLIAFSARLRRLSDQVTQDVLAIYRLHDIAFELRFAPILLVLKDGQGHGVSALAQTLGLTKAAVSQAVGEMLKEGLLSEKTSLTDRRCKQLLLTPKGQALVSTLTPIWERAAGVFGSLISETGLPVQEVVSGLEDSLETRSVLARYQARLHNEEAQ